MERPTESGEGIISVISCCALLFVDRKPFPVILWKFDPIFNREDLRRRFVKAETTLFKVRYDTDLGDERVSFLSSRNFNWIPVRL